MKIVVFDLDETLGYFVQMGVFYECLKFYLNVENIEIDQNDFNNILDLFPEFLRPNILEILKYIQTRKENNICKNVFIYTNNRGSKLWVQSIINYFESKMNYKLFDHIILAFKINGNQIELCRTSHLKTHSDLINCGNIPSNAEICYIDDFYYKDMENSNVYYIKIKPYKHNLDFKLMCDRFIKSNIGKKFIKNNDPNTFMEIMASKFKLYIKNSIKLKNSKEYNIDKIISKQILNYIKNFFEKKNNKTKKNKNIVNNKTMKINN